MAHKCPECKRTHNEIASWTLINGKKVSGFCSDSCRTTYEAKNPETRKKPKGIGGLIFRGIKDTLNGFGN